jgi:hypothetical protein
MLKIHPAVQVELNMLREMFPGKCELNFDDYAVYFGISRRYAPQHLARLNGGAAKAGIQADRSALQLHDV